jgi:hypothetical protein
MCARGSAREIFNLIICSGEISSAKILFLRQFDLQPGHLLR